MSTDDKPLLTEWRDEGAGWHSRYLAADGDDVRVRLLTRGYLIWGEDAKLLANGTYFGSVEDTRAAADAVARQWYTLPSPTGQPAAPPEHEEDLDDECSSCGEECAPEGECAKSKRPCGHHCNHSWSQDTCCWCGVEFGEDGVPIHPAVPPAASPPPVAEPTTRCRMGCGNLATHGPAGEAWACWQHAGDWPMVPSHATTLPSPASEGATAIHAMQERLVAACERMGAAEADHARLVEAARKVVDTAGDNDPYFLPGELDEAIVALRTALGGGQ